MRKIPRAPGLDSTLALFREGYCFMPNHFERLHTDLFLMRFVGQKTVCMHGPEAVELFYDESRFQRGGAIPRRVLTTLFGKRAVHTLDDAVHRDRKAAFLSVMTAENLARLMDIMSCEWRSAIRRWEAMDKVVLFEQAQQLLTRAVCEWAGVRLEEDEVARRAADFHSMIDAFGGVGLRLWKGKFARHRAQKWIMGQIDEIRGGKRAVPTDTSLYIMARYRGTNGELLDSKTAAVELINVLRPTVAISWYIAFAAHALHHNPDVVAALRADDTGGYPDWVMQEIRRYYPFVPFLGAKVREPFTWKNCRFKKGMLVLLDVYGLQHDPQLWESPEQFRPMRFNNRNLSPFNFIPQGGGSPVTGHRCPGEWLTMHAVTLALHFMTRCMRYEIAPGQDLEIDLTRMPTGVKSGMVLQRVKATRSIDDPPPSLPSASAIRGAEQVLQSTSNLDGGAALIGA